MSQFLIILFISLFLFNINSLATILTNKKQFVSAGMYLIHVGDIDIKSQTFKAEFYLNFKWKGNRSSKNFEFLNAAEFSQFFLTEWVEDGYNYLACKIVGTFRSKMDVSKFPFDSQNLKILIGNFDWIEDSLQYLTNDTLTGISKDISILDWITKGYSFKVQPMIEMNSTYSVLDFTFQVERRSAFFFIKIFIPLIIVLLVALLNLYIPKDEIDTCIGLGVTSILSMIALHFSVSSQLPDVNYPTRVDILMIGSYLLVFISMMEVVFIYNKIKQNKLSLVQKIEKLARWTIPSVYIFFLILLFEVYKLF